MKLLQNAAITFCVGTMLVQLVILYQMWEDGAFTPEKFRRIMAIVYDVDDLLDQETNSAEATPVADKQLAHVPNPVDPHRDDAVYRAQRELFRTRHDLEARVDRFKRFRQTFNQELDEKKKAEAKEGLRQVQATLEVISAKAAKEQIVLAIESGQLKLIAQVVRNMNPDKRKKILTEFKDDADKRLRMQILREIKVGVAE